MTPTHVLQFLEYVRQKRGKNDARTAKFGVRASVGGRRREVAGRTVGRGKKWRGKGQRTRQGRRAKVAGRSRRGRRGKVVGGPRPGSKGEGQREVEEGRGAKVPMEERGCRKVRGGGFLQVCRNRQPLWRHLRAPCRGIRKLLRLRPSGFLPPPPGISPSRRVLRMPSVQEHRGR